MRRLMIIALLLVLLAPSCRASDSLWDALGLDELARAGRSYGAEVELSEDLSMEKGVAALARRAGQIFPTLLRGAAGSVLTIMAVVLLCAMAEGAEPPGGGGLPVPVIAGALALAAACAGQMGGMIGLGRETIRSMSGFSRALLPVMAACTAACGSVSAAAVRQMTTAAFADLLMEVVERLLVPLIYAYLAACTAYAAVGNRGLKQVARLLKWTVTTLLTALLIAFIGYLTVSGAIAGTADAAAIKATRTAIATAVPVVGRVLSDAAETMLVSAGILKNAVGLFGMLTVLGIALVPFLRLGAHYLLYKVSAALASTVTDGRLAELIDDIGTAFGLILAITGACTLLLLVGVVSGMLGGIG